MLKSYLFIASIFIFHLLNAQTPDGFYFQAVAQHSDGSPIEESEVSLKISLIQDHLDPQLRYSEIHEVRTNNMGQFQIMVGEGIVYSGSMEYVSWHNGNIDLKIEIDPEGGYDFHSLGSTALANVPFAMYSQAAKTLSSTENVEISSNQDIKLSFENVFEINTNEQPAFFVDENGKIGLGTNQLDDDQRKDIEIGLNKRLWGYSNEWHLDMSGVYNLQAIDSFSKPAIVWYSPTKTRQAAMVAHIKSHTNGTHNHWSVETTDNSGSLQTRFEIPLDKDVTTIQTHSAHFKVADDFDFITTGKIKAYGAYKAGFGDKDWESVGNYGNSKWEFYRSDSHANLLIHSGSSTKNSELMLKSGIHEWTINQNGKLRFNYNKKQVLLMSENGNVAIGNNTSNSKLHIDGDVSVSKGYGYKTAGADFAEYFAASEKLNAGDIAGINTENGLIRKYQKGDELIGVVSDDAGFIGNVNQSADDYKVLVGLIGQLKFDKEHTIIKNGIVYTTDMKKIGVLLSNGKVYLK